MLQYLYLNDNNLTSLPDTLGDLDDLLVITAVNNQIVSLPESISDLEKIQTIEFGTNAIGNVPEYIGNLSSLGYLDLSENNISALPESIGDLNADILLLSSNDFADIPESMFDNTYQYLFVDDNSLQFGSIEPFIGNVSDEFAYTPQDNFGNDTTLYPETGTNFEFVLETTGEYNVYQWYKDGDILEGQTSDTLSFYEITEEDNGTYNLEVSNTLATELTLMSHIVIINTITTGVDEQPSGEITVYPNPVTGSTLGIRTGTTDPVRIQIINLTGRVLNEVVLTGVTSQIDISDLPDGLYLLKIYDNENTLNVVKFIKN